MVAHVGPRVRISTQSHICGERRCRIGKFWCDRLPVASPKPKISLAMNAEAAQTITEDAANSKAVEKDLSNSKPHIPVATSPTSPGRSPLNTFYTSWHTRTLMMNRYLHHSLAQPHLIHVRARDYPARRNECHHKKT